MTQFIELLHQRHLARRSCTRCVALGFVVIFKSSHVINFAHGSIVLLGAFSIAKLVGRPRLPARPSLVGVAIAAVAAALIYCRDPAPRPRPRRRHGDDRDDRRRHRARHRAGAPDRPGGAEHRRPVGLGVVRFGDFSIPEARVAAAVVALVLLGAFLAAFRFSPWGVAMRAAAEDGEAAALMGIRLRRVVTGAWFVAGALAAVGAIFLVTFPTPGVDRDVGPGRAQRVPGRDPRRAGLRRRRGRRRPDHRRRRRRCRPATRTRSRSSGAASARSRRTSSWCSCCWWRPAGLFGTKELTRV